MVEGRHSSTSNTEKIRHLSFISSGNSPNCSAYHDSTNIAAHLGSKWTDRSQETCKALWRDHCDTQFLVEPMNPTQQPQGVGPDPRANSYESNQSTNSTGFPTTSQLCCKWGVRQVTLGPERSHPSKHRTKACSNTAHLETARQMQHLTVQLCRSTWKVSFWVKVAHILWL